MCVQTPKPEFSQGRPSVHLDKLQSHPNNSHRMETAPVVVVAVVVVTNDLGLVVLRESGKKQSRQTPGRIYVFISRAR